MVLLAHQSFQALNNLPTAHPSPEAFGSMRILPQVNHIPGKSHNQPLTAEKFITVATALGPVALRQMATLSVGTGVSHSSHSEAMRNNAGLN
jgi:hypothetical protein